MRLPILVACMLMIKSMVSVAFASKMSFWDIQQKGANIFNRHIIVEDIKIAKQYGIQFIRLAPDKFVSTQRDFLIGNADDYVGLVKEDVEKLKSILDSFYQEGMPVVLTMLSLPGSRWRQNNQDKDDLRIWTDKGYQIQAAHFWQDVASELKNHPAIIGYNILNEPHPERIFESKEVSIPIHTVCQEEVQKMLYSFYQSIIKSIRSVDKNTPIILDSSAYADANTFDLLMPQEDQNILYSFHMYEPYEYTNHKINKGKFCYPGYINGNQWNKEALKDYMKAVMHFQKNHNIVSSRILVGEFGGNRKSSGLELYFQDLMAIFNEESWHFAFYAFREDTWDGMDYELGDKKLPWDYWQAVKRGETPTLKRQSTHRVFSVIKKALSYNDSIEAL